MNSCWRNQGSHTLVLGKSFCKFSLIFKLYSFFYRWCCKGSLLGRFMAGRLATLHSNSYPSHNCKSKRLFHFIHSRSSFSLNWNFSFIETSITQKLNNLNFSCYLLSSWIYYLPSRIREFSHWIPQTYFFVKVFVFSSFQTLDFFWSISFETLKLHLRLRPLHCWRPIRKFNTNDLLQVRRSFKVLNLDCCVMCLRSKESIQHLFLHCLVTLSLRNRLFSVIGID